MTGKERMLAALAREKPDRLPVTIHQWQDYHLRNYMNGMDAVEAFAATGLDAAVTPGVLAWEETPDWQWGNKVLEQDERGVRRVHWADTPKGRLDWETVTLDYTTYVSRHLIRDQRDAEIFLEFWPRMRLDHERLDYWVERTGDSGIVRGFVATFAQPGSWQEFCELVGTEQAILWAFDDPAFVHHFLREITDRKVEYVYCEMEHARFDLIEHGGGAASCTVISPDMFDEFCVPNDRRVIDALHEIDMKVVYHTCGGMMKILDRIPANGTDASETLSPPGVGGDIRAENRRHVRRTLGQHVALIGGMDQGNILTDGTPEQVQAEVRACFETFGEEGGYICSASDHFFTTPVENLRAMAEAARECRYY